VQDETQLTVPCPGNHPRPATRQRIIRDSIPFTRISLANKRRSFANFRFSKSDRDQEDDASVRDLNVSMRGNLAPVGGPRDARANYRLVGAMWLEHPRDGNGRAGDFRAKSWLCKSTGPKYGGSLARCLPARWPFRAPRWSLSRSGTPQVVSPCHDTKAVRSDQDGSVILKPTRLNVSHVISRYLSGSK